MPEFSKPFRPFKATFRRTAVDDNTVNFTTAVSIDGGEATAIATTVCSKVAAKDPDTVYNVKVDHHNKLVAALTQALQQKLKL